MCGREKLARRSYFALFVKFNFSKEITRIFKSLATFLFAMEAFAPAANAQSSDVYELRSKDIICLTSNASAYLDQDKDPMLIFLEICPRVEPTMDELLSASTNALPDIAVESIIDEQPASIISLRKKALNCLVGKYKSGDYTTTSSDGDPLIQIDLGDCR